MAITLRNKRVEEDIKEIGRQTGEGPSAIIARLAAEEKQRLCAKRERETQERLARLHAFLDTLPVPTDEERKAMWRELDHLHDYLYEDEDEEPK